jgi:hypothetical protein
LTPNVVATHDFPTVLELDGVLRQLKLGAEIWCKQKHEAILTRVAAGRWKIVGKLTADIPIGARQLLDEAIKSSSKEEGGCFYCPGCPRDRLCQCKGMQTIPGADHDALYAFCLAGQKFVVAKPWLYMRMNHLFAVTATNCDYKYVQIMGGGGNCDVTMILYKTWDNVQNEETPQKDILSKPTVQIHFYKAYELSTAWYYYLVEKLDAGTPFPMPDPTLSNDPYYHEMLPAVIYGTRIDKGDPSASGEKLMFSQAQATLSELRAATICLEAVARVISGGHLLALPGAIVGDKRKYYRFDEKFEVDLPRTLTTAGEGAGQVSVRVKFPAMLDPDKLSWLQVRA